MTLFQSAEADPLLPFVDRPTAGTQLAQAVLAAVRQHDPARYFVYALPRGGLPVAAPVAQSLGCPLDVVVAKKITRPDNRELAIGAVTSEGQVIWAHPDQPSETNFLGLEQAQAHAQHQLSLLAPPIRLNPQGAIAVLVDDGIATGMTMAAAVMQVRSQAAAEVWICAPVAPLDLLPYLQTLGDRVIVLASPTPFYSVSRFYKAFTQVSTEIAATYLQQV
jgi:putative phosphoribosyl transferase